MYNGHFRIKIDGIEISDDLIRQYSFEKEPRIIMQKKDGRGVEHRVVNGDIVTISFQIRPHLSSEHNAIQGIISSFDNRSVYYMDEQTGAWSTGNFKMKKVEWKHHAIYGREIVYEAMDIVLTEY